MPPTPRSAAYLLAVLDAERSRGFDGLAGSRVEATLPLRQVALDAALAQVVTWPAPLEHLAVEIGDANRLHVTATVRVLGFRTPLRLQLRLDPSVEHGVVRLALDDGSLLASALSLFGSSLGRLPRGVVLEGRQLTVDVRQLAVQQGLGDLAAMLSSASLTSSRGVLWITASIDVPAPSGIAHPRDGQRPSIIAPLSFDVAQLTTWLQGARFNADVCVDERLANDLVAAMHAEAQVTSGDAARDLATRALQRLVVHFEPGVLRLTAAAALDGEGGATRGPGDGRTGGREDWRIAYRDGTGSSLTLSIVLRSWDRLSSAVRLVIQKA